MYLEESIRLVNTKLTILKEKRNIAIWGAAENTVRLFQYTDITKYNINMIIDNGKCGAIFFGKVISASDKVQWDTIDAVVISAFYKEDEIFYELKNKYLFKKTIVRLNDSNQEKPFYQYLTKSDLRVPLEYQDIIYENKKFHNIHQGERIFIIGNGPSIKNTDLTKIKNAKKMVVSNFYMHEDYNIIKPDYYCFAQFTYNDVLTDSFYDKWLFEIGEKSGNPQFFFDISEKRLIDKCSIFKGKKINYMCLDALNLDYYDEVDITNKILRGQSVTIDCIQLAIYMGFKQIYLVGVEHSEIVTGQYDYFYNRDQNIIGDKDSHHLPNGKVTSGFEMELFMKNNLWNQYRKLKMIAKVNEIDIFNATKSGILDVFSKVDYDLLF